MTRSILSRHLSGFETLWRHCGGSSQYGLDWYWHRGVMKVCVCVCDTSQCIISVWTILSKAAVMWGIGVWSGYWICKTFLRNCFYPLPANQNHTCHESRASDWLGGRRRLLVFAYLISSVCNGIWRFLFGWSYLFQSVFCACNYRVQCARRINLGLVSISIMNGK